MELILVRHAKAFERDPAAWPDDSRRPLTAEGRAAFERLAERLGRIHPRVDLVESSGFERAWRTAQLLSRHAGWPEPSRLERLEPRHGEEDEGAQLEALRRTAAALSGIGRVVWVGHEPTLSRLASLLLTGSPEGMSIRFRKGAAMSLRVERDAEGGLVSGLQWMATPALAARRRRRG